MKINSINKNYQKQQSFGATSSKAFSRELKLALELTSTPQELVTFFREETKLAEQVPPQDFAARLKAIKAIGSKGKEVDPHVNATALNGSPESATIYLNIKLPHQEKGSDLTISKTKSESPRTFIDRFLDTVQGVAESLQTSEDVELAANQGMNTFLSRLV